MLLRKETFEYEGVEITVQTSTGLTALDRIEIVAQLKGKSGRGVSHNELYAELVAQTVSVKNGKKLGLVVPKADAPASEHIVAFPMILGQPIDLINQWAAAARRTNVPPGTKPELQPDVKSDDPKSIEQDETASSG